MPEFQPFRGILYDTARVDPADVVAPPYDVINDEYRDKLYQASPFNIVRLDLSRDPYASAAADFGRWKAEKILVKDARPSIYMLRQEFLSPEGRPLKRRGFIARCRLEDFSAGTILPHEKTMPKPREDRLHLLRATHAHFSQIFALYADPDHVTDEWFDGEEGDLLVDVKFEGVQNRLSRLVDTERISSIERFMLDNTILIADGHHRYETSLLYRDLMRQENPHDTGKEPYNFVMMYCTNLHDDALLILPTHRLLHDVKLFESRRVLEAIGKFFEIFPCESEATMLHRLGQTSRHAFGVVLPAGFCVCRLRDTAGIAAFADSGIPHVLKDLDVTVLHGLVFEKILGISPAAQEDKKTIEYVKESWEAIQAVRHGRARAAFLMNPTPIEQVRAVARAGFTMPQKSTYFYPKLLSGLVIDSLDERD